MAKDRDPRLIQQSDTPQEAPEALRARIMANLKDARDTEDRQTRRSATGLLTPHPRSPMSPESESLGGTFLGLSGKRPIQQTANTNADEVVFSSWSETRGEISVSRKTVVDKRDPNSGRPTTMHTEVTRLRPGSSAKDHEKQVISDIKSQESALGDSAGW